MDHHSAARISPTTRPRVASTSTSRSVPSGRATRTASRPSTATRLTSRVPAGWPRWFGVTAKGAAEPPARWTTSTTSVTVPATISTPITPTSHLSAATSEPPPIHQELIAPADSAGERADRFLTRTLGAATGALSRSRVKALIEGGFATRDGQPMTDPSEAVRAGARYALAPPPPEPAAPLPQAMALTILFEDADLIVLDKPAGLVVHPAPGNPDGTLVNAVLAHAGDELSGIGGEKRPGIVHRLDKDTSGLMVVAKSARAHAALSEAFATRDLEREYLALAWGVPTPPTGSVEAPIGRHPADRKRMAVVARGGKPALTHFRTERAFGPAASLLRCKLATGRTHQIRVHLAHLGHPIIGDPVYLRRTPASAAGLPRTARDAALAFPRQALHAISLGFRHPASGAWLSFRQDPPADMQALIGLLAGNGV